MKPLIVTIALPVLAFCATIAVLHHAPRPPEPDEAHRHPLRPAAASSPGLPVPASAPPGRGSAHRAKSAPVEPGRCAIQAHYLPNGDGTVAGVLRCDNAAPRQRHAYVGYADEALASLAWADAAAAEVLGKRLLDSDRGAAMRLLLRASALSGGDPAPIRWYWNAYPQPTFVNGVPVRQTVRDKYLLSSVMRRLGDDHHGLGTTASIIRRYSTDPEREIAQLESRAEAIVAAMRRIRREVTGSSGEAG